MLDQDLLDAHSTANVCPTAQYVSERYNDKDCGSVHDSDPIESMNVIQDEVYGQAQRQNGRHGEIGNHKYCRIRRQQKNCNLFMYSETPAENIYDSSHWAHHQMTCTCWFLIVIIFLFCILPLISLFAFLIHMCSMSTNGTYAFINDEYVRMC